MHERAPAFIIARVDVAIASLPIDLTPLHAVEGAYAAELDELAAAARRGETALIECDAELAQHLHRALKERLADPSAGRPMTARYVAGNDPARLPLGGRYELEVRPTSLGEALQRELQRLLQEGATSQLLVVGHFELLAPSANDGAPARVAREVAALLHDNPGVPLLALHAPDVLVPEALARAFTRRGLVGPVSVGRLRHLVLRREARKLGVEAIDLDDLACALDGLNALELRQALSRLEGRVDHDPRFPAEREALLAELAVHPRRAREPRPMAAHDAPSGMEWRLRRRPPG